MIPYEVYVLTADVNGEVATAIINWVTEPSFVPPWLTIGVKADSGVHALIKRAAIVL